LLIAYLINPSIAAAAAAAAAATTATTAEAADDVKLFSSSLQNDIL
jgi:hypothetical protein